MPWRRDLLPTPVFLGFPGGSDGKESAWNAGDLGLIPGSGRSPGEGIYYPLQYSWVSLVAQMVKNLPEMQETWVWSLGQEDALEKGYTAHSCILENPMDRGAWWATVHTVAQSQARLSTWSWKPPLPSPSYLGLVDWFLCWLGGFKFPQLSLPATLPTSTPSP